MAQVRATAVTLRSTPDRRVPGSLRVVGYEWRMNSAAWMDAVHAAARDDDQTRLRMLFEHAVEAWGREEASRRWLAALSGFDAGAITG